MPHEKHPGTCVQPMYYNMKVATKIADITSTECQEKYCIITTLTTTNHHYIRNIVQLVQHRDIYFSQKQTLVTTETVNHQANFPLLQNKNKTNAANDTE